MTEKTVVLVGTLDTKGAEYQYLRERLQLAGVRALLVDVGTLAPPATGPEVPGGGGPGRGVPPAGGSGNTAIAPRAMRALPVGLPELMVSTVAAGDTRDYVGA